MGPTNLLGRVGPGVILLDPCRGVQLPRASYFANQGNGIGVWVGLQDLKCFPEISSGEDITPYTNT